MSDDHKSNKQFLQTQVCSLACVIAKQNLGFLFFVFLFFFVHTRRTPPTRTLHVMMIECNNQGNKSGETTPLLNKLRKSAQTAGRSPKSANCRPLAATHRTTTVSNPRRTLLLSCCMLIFAVVCVVSFLFLRISAILHITGTPAERCAKAKTDHDEWLLIMLVCRCLEICACWLWIGAVRRRVTNSDGQSTGPLQFVFLTDTEVSVVALDDPQVCSFPVFGLTLLLVQNPTTLHLASVH